jgi:hypothetical protein
MEALYIYISRKFLPEQEKNQMVALYIYKILSTCGYPRLRDQFIDREEGRWTRRALHNCKEEKKTTYTKIWDVHRINKIESRPLTP